jgi:pyruvate dehydrogenase (quinone)
MSKTVGQVLVDTLVAAGVQRVYGLPGDSLNAITDAIRRTDGIVWGHVRHEETAAFAASQSDASGARYRDADCHRAFGRGGCRYTR